MYGIWILVIIFAIIGPTLVIAAHFIETMPGKSRDKLTYYWTSSSGYTDDYRFCDSARDRERLSEQDYNKYLEIYKKYNWWLKFSNVSLEVPAYIIGWLIIIATIVLIFVAIFVPMEAAREVAYWSEFAPMVENTMLGSDSLQDIGITEKIVEYNSWLAKARSSQEIYKNFSSYYRIDLSTLEYIKIGQ